MEIACGLRVWHVVGPVGPHQDGQWADGTHTSTHSGLPEYPAQSTPTEALAANQRLYFSITKDRKGLHDILPDVHELLLQHWGEMRYNKMKEDSGKVLCGISF